MHGNVIQYDLPGIAVLKKSDVNARVKRFCIGWFIAATLPVSLVAGEELHWPMFRGPAGLPIVAEGTLPDKFGEKFYATPAFVDGTLYLRTDRALWAFR